MLRFPTIPDWCGATMEYSHKPCVHQSQLHLNIVVTCSCCKQSLDLHIGFNTAYVAVNNAAA